MSFKKAVLLVILLIPSIAYLNYISRDKIGLTTPHIPDDLPPLHMAVAKGQLEVVKKIIGEGTDVNLKGEKEFTPLHTAAKHGQFNIAKFLIDHGADIEAKADMESTPLYWAAMLRKLDIVKLLIEKGANVQARLSVGTTPLHGAAFYDNTDEVAYLLDHGANIEAKNEADDTPLHYSIELNAKNAAALLIERGANIEAVNEEGLTSLLRATSGDREEIVSLLINKGANLEATDKSDLTSLYLAVNEGHKNIAKLLIKAGANVAARDSDGWTPLVVARKKGYTELVKLLDEKSGTKDGDEKKITKNIDPMKDTAPGKLFLSNHGIEFAWIPAGSFLMGSPDNEDGRSKNEGPVHKVVFRRGFWMSKNEVTQSLWKFIMGANPASFKNKPNFTLKEEKERWLANKSTKQKADNINSCDNPVEQITFEDSQMFISKLNEKEAPYRYAIPTESQWEYACRATTTGRYNFGEKIHYHKVIYLIRNPYVINSNANSDDTTDWIRGTPANAWGLFGMHGNVREWCSDSWHDNYTGAPVDGSSWNDRPGTAHVIRGGAFDSNGRDCRSAKRTRGEIGYESDNLGLRLVLIEE